MPRSCFAVIIAIIVATPAAAAPPSADVVGRLTRLEPAISGEVVKVSVPRGELGIVADGVRLHAFQGLTSWAAFQNTGDATMMMGDLVLLEHEVNPAMSAALAGGLEVTALHNHFFYMRPAVFFMHIGGHGPTETLATAVRLTLDAIEHAPPGDGFAGPTIPGQSAIDADPLQGILGQKAETKAGMAKFVFGRTTKMHGVDAGAAMGVNTWAVFAGSSAAAVVDGDFAMLEDELQKVLKVLRAADISVVAIHNHMTHEVPRVVFLHFWAKGRADDLARGIAAARASQRQS